METFKQRIAGMNNHYRFYQLETFFASLQANQIHYAELWTGPMHFYVDQYQHDDVARLIALQAKYQVKVIGLCPEQTNPKPHHIATKYHQDALIGYYRQLMDAAKQLDCKQLLVTSGWVYLDENRQAAWNRSIAMMKQIAAMAADNHITLVMEALQPDESLLVNSVRDLRRYLAEVQNDVLQICIDFGAMARAKDTLTDYFEAFGNRIAHIHFVDGSPTGHLAWGDGSRDLKADLSILKDYGYQGYLSLETAVSRYFQKPWNGERKTLATWKEAVGEGL